ncbi:MAG: flavodoxin-dependent (E)-4-hydroxy-3-methylbut-2-enyl-diphosphate synthase [Candidatus Omnitrophica bacterium]|nr:flavodoxin-dependent (E)-4-hydroxy-3-methylbut-2-enyl-diphosphate synthase [Candidatus Omnitrophota bacterium]
MIKRRKTKTIKIGAVKIGGESPISIQSMSKTETRDINSTVKQIKVLERAGCQIVRVAVKNMDCAQALDKIKSKIGIALVADIHFNYQLALEAIKRGVDGIRLNPGNIYRREEVKEVVRLAKKNKIPIRVGINAGSLRTKQSADLMVKSAQAYIKMLEGFGFYDIIVSLKASDVLTTVKAYRKLAGLSSYPFHLGITASGLPEQGTIKSALAIGSLLLDGIGDTVRVSLTGPPEQEVEVAKDILQALGLRNFGPEIISCPTCGRTQVDIASIVQEITTRLHGRRRTSGGAGPRKLAIMGCEVNGPGEARDADLGVACGKGSAVLFKKGKIVKRITQNQIVNSIMHEFKGQSLEE